MPYARRAAQTRLRLDEGARVTIGPEFWEPLPEEELKLWEGR